MGMVKWTGEGFKLIGEILTNETVEEWLKEHGKELILNLFQKMTAKWMFGHMRAGRQAKKFILHEVNGSALLRMSLNDSLNKLPNIIQRLALHIIKAKIDVLTKEGRLWKQLVIVPRAIVLNDFRITLIEDLGQASELKRFEAFPEIFLRRQAEQAEQTFLDTFKKNNNSVVVSNSGIILLADHQFDWHLGNIWGHYYFGYTDSLSEDLTQKKERKEFIKDIQPTIDAKMIELGKLTAEEIDNTNQRFFQK
jgi:hypothetical protein